MTFTGAWHHAAAAMAKPTPTPRIQSNILSIRYHRGANRRRAVASHSKTMEKLLLLSMFAAVAWGQASFESATIKPASPDRTGSGMNLTPGRVRIMNCTLKQCVQFAWNVKDFQVNGANGWM